MLPGLTDPVLDSQRIFRATLDAMAHPGRIVNVPGPVETPAPLDPAAVAVLLTLADLDTALWLDAAAATTKVTDYLKFHCGCPVVASPSMARFAVVADAVALPDFVEFANGSDEEPHLSTTVIIQVPGLNDRTGRRLSGPGIRDHAMLGIDGAPARFWAELAANHRRFPCGVDVILTAGTVLAALPRTVRAED